ncbi:unnamed protein product [Hymenolepis diminuta]|uniref:Uncharacterized protein n=1 Tax=Hymenolepis diminuta TaxID=6216 RepID=A0A564YXP1_HYMDI|nr:unnamed protein product [Hymenolepis diminuta]
MNPDTHKCLKRLSIRYTRSLVTSSPPPFHATLKMQPKLIYSNLLYLSSLLYQWDRASRSNHLRELGKSILNSDAPEQQTVESSAASAETHPPSFLPRPKPNNYPNAPTPNRWWKNPPRGNNMSGHFHRPNL